VSAVTCSGVYATDDPAGDQRGLARLPDPPPLSPLLRVIGYDDEDGDEYERPL